MSDNTATQKKPAEANKDTKAASDTIDFDNPEFNYELDVCNISFSLTFVLEP